MATITAKPFRLALLQLGPLGKVKQQNIESARKAVLAAAGSSPKPSLIVLPEIWNSPYAVNSFREYSEAIPEPGSRGSSENEEGETVRALREMAKEAGCWLIGGESPSARPHVAPDEAGSDVQDLSRRLKHLQTRSTTRQRSMTQKAIWLPNIVKSTCSTLTFRASRHSK
jgi:predicted amidohydrolase